MWLLDANIDVRVADILAEFGIESHTSESLGWKALSNGDLVAAAAGAGFTCLLTRDRLFAESASRSLKRFPEFAIVILRLPQQKWPQYVISFRALWSEQPIIVLAGQVSMWPT